MSADLLCGTGFSLCPMTKQRKLTLTMKPVSRETLARISRSLVSGFAVCDPDYRCNPIASRMANSTAE